MVNRMVSTCSPAAVDKKAAHFPAVAAYQLGRLHAHPDRLLDPAVLDL